MLNDLEQKYYTVVMQLMLAVMQPSTVLNHLEGTVHQNGSHIILLPWKLQVPTEHINKQWLKRL